jgi:hypothetical protein
MNGAFTFPDDCYKSGRKRKQQHTVENIKTISFTGMRSLPTKTAFNPDFNQIFVPTTANYEGFDFFLWDSKQKCLYGFQVTVLQPYTKHAKFERKNVEGNIAKWKEYCGGQMMKVKWIVPKKCVPAGSNTGDHDLILFEELWESFPILKRLKLK